MPQSVAEMTITLHFQIDFHGESVTQVLEVPAVWRNESHQRGVELYCTLDGAKFAEALYPLVMEEFARRESAQVKGP